MSNQYLKSDYREGDPLRKVANAQQANRIANILNTLKGVGCRVQRDYTAEGLGWSIVVDGTSDIEPPDSLAVSSPQDAYKVAVDSDDTPDYLSNQISGLTAYDSTTDVLLSYYINPAGTRTLRFFAHVGTGTPTQVLGRTSGGTLCWVTLTDTCG